MKIVQIFPGKVWGGAEQYILDLGSRLKARGHEVVYVCRNAEKVTDNLRKKNVVYSSLPFSWTFDRKSIIGLADLIKDADIVNVHDPMFVPSIVLAKKKSGSNARLVLTRHVTHRTSVCIFYRHFFKHLHCVICVSNLVKKRWHGANKWFPEERCKVVHNSIPPMPATGNAESLREKYEIPASTPLLIFSGRVRKSKGCTTIVKALSKISDSDFAMVFIGVFKKGYDAKLLEIAENGDIADRIRFYGFSDNARALMSQADIGLSPSIVRDSFLLSNAEFMQSGICVVTTNNGGQPEYLENNVNGLLVDPDNDNQLADAIKKLIDNPTLRQTIADAGRKHFEANMTYDKFVDRIIAVYN